MFSRTHSTFNRKSDVLLAGFSSRDTFRLGLLSLDWSLSNKRVRAPCPWGVSGRRTSWSEPGIWSGDCHGFQIIGRRREGVSMCPQDSCSWPRLAKKLATSTLVQSGHNTCTLLTVLTQIISRCDLGHKTPNNAVFPSLQSQFHKYTYWSAQLLQCLHSLSTRAFERASC